MLTIDETKSLCTVIVTVDADPVHMSDLLEHAELGLGRFAGFNGFVSGALHSSADRGRLIQYLQWETEALYRSCIDDPTWADLPSTVRFMALVESGLARVDVRVYSVRATGGGSSGSANR